MRVGLFGGSFNPVHNGHIIAAQQVLEKAVLDQIWFIPAYVAPHKQHKWTYVENTDNYTKHRVNMLNLALGYNDNFLLSRVELERGGVSFTWHTIRELVTSFPDFKFFLMIGSDLVQRLNKWYKIDDITSVCEILVMDRGLNLSNSPTTLRYKLRFLELGIKTNISSTVVRERVRKNLSLQSLLPDQVIKYIKEHRLYAV